jgi:hypothetical protein
VLSLPAGIVTVSLRAQEAASFEVPDDWWTKLRPAFILRSVELTPVAAKTKIVESEERARGRR